MKNKVLDIKFKKSNNKIMSVWEIQDFMNKLVTNYYKIDLVNEISKEINNGTKLEKIVIMDKAFDFKVNYKYLADTDIINLTTENGAKNLFHLGTPIGMFPSKEIVELGVKFDLVREINTFLHNKKVDKLNKKYISYLIELDIKSCIEFIRDESTEIIFKYFDKQDKRSVYIEELRDICRNSYRTIEEYNDSENNINYIKKSITELNVENISNLEEEIYNLYFKKFINKMSSIERPVVGVLSDDNRYIKILCKSYIHKRSRDERFLDLKNFSHNSPTLVSISAGLMFATPMIPLIKGIKESIVNKIEGKELDERETHIINKLEDMDKELVELQEKENLNESKKIEINIVNNYMNGLNSELITRVNNNLATYNFDNRNIDINVIDFEKEKNDRIRRKRKK